MSIPIVAVIAVVAVAIVAAIVYAFVRRSPRVVAISDGGDEFADLTEAERCDYVFALSALDDPANVDLLRRAVDDPSDVVAIAAARSLVLSGRRDEVDALLARRGDERSARIASALELLA